MSALLLLLLWSPDTTGHASTPKQATFNASHAAATNAGSRWFESCVQESIPGMRRTVKEGVAFTNKQSPVHPRRQRDKGDWVALLRILQVGKHPGMRRTVKKGVALTNKQAIFGASQAAARQRRGRAASNPARINTGERLKTEEDSNEALICKQVCDYWSWPDSYNCIG